MFDQIFSGTQIITTTVKSVLVYDNEHAGEAQLDVTAASGTTPTLDVVLQDSVDGSNYDDITGGTFAQKTAAGRERITLADIKGDRVQLVATITGTTPSFTFSVKIVSKEG